VSGRNSTGRFSWFPVIESEPAESCLYVSGVLRKVVLVDLSGTIFRPDTGYDLEHTRDSQTTILA
jgi:hypothetical protein